jgi:hypothetical protein
MSETPPIPAPDIAAIPDDLKRKKQWICWRYEERDGKAVKVPIAPWVTGDTQPASVTDPNNIATFAQAITYAEKFNCGIGFVFFRGAGVTGIDLDHIDENLKDEADEILKKANSYAEYSPSCKGIHIIGCGVVNKPIKKPGLEIYSEDRFFTVTGHHVEGTPTTLNNIQALLDELQEKYGEKPRPVIEAKPVKGWEEHVNELGYTLKEVRERDKVLDEYLNGGLAGKPSDSEADMGALERLLFWGYTSDEAVSILKFYRQREKLKRDDYIRGMLDKLLPVRERASPKAQDVKLNDYRFEASGKNFFLYDSTGGVVYSNKVAYLNTKTVKKDLQKQTKADESEVNKAVALFLQYIKKVRPQKYSYQKVIVEGKQWEISASGYNIRIVGPDGRFSTKFFIDFRPKGWAVVEPIHLKVECARLNYNPSETDEPSFFKTTCGYLISGENVKVGSNGERFFKLDEELREIPLCVGDEIVQLKPLGTGLESQITYPEGVDKFLSGYKPNIKEIFEKVKEQIRKYVNFEWDLRLYDVISCYIIATFFFDAFEAFPHLFFYGSMKSGKTRATYTVAALGHRGLILSYLTEATYFRLVEELEPLLAIDEHYLKGSMSQLMRSGYKKGTKVPREKKVKSEREENFITELFNFYTKFLYNSNDPPDEITKSRAILITMKPSPDPSPSEQAPTMKEMADLRDDLYIARLTFFGEVLELKDKVKPKESITPADQLTPVQADLTGRDFELWRPLLTAAKLISEEVYETVRLYAYETTTNREEYEKERIIIEAIENNLNKDSESIELTSTDITKSIWEMVKEEYLNPNTLQYNDKEFSNKWSPSKVGRILSSMGLKPVHKGKHFYRLEAREIADLCIRYNYTPKHPNIVSLVSIVSSQRKKVEEDNKQRPRKETKETKETNIEHNNTVHDVKSKSKPKSNPNAKSATETVSVTSVTSVTNPAAKPKQDDSSSLAAQDNKAKDTKDKSTPAKLYRCKTCGCGS